MSWKKVTLETLYDAPSRNGLYKSKEFHGSGVRIVNMGEMFAFPFIGNQNMQLLNVTDDELYRFGLQSGDLLFARRSLVEAGAGKCSLVVDHNNPMVFESSMIRVRLQKDFCNPKFYYHYFKSHVGRSTITAIITGVAQKGIRGSELAKIEVDLPPLPTQQRIADILSAYDDLIDNNNRRIALLEESIHLLYKEWFVNLRFPNCDRVKLVDGVPEGWETFRLDDLVLEIIDYRGKTPKKLGSDWSDTGIIALSALNVKQGRLINLEKSKRVDEDLYKKWMKSDLRKGDILMTSEAPLGELYYFSSDKKFCLSQRLYSIRANPEIIEPAILFCALSSRAGQGEIHARQSGTTVLGIRQSALRDVLILVPSLDLQRRAATILDNLFKQKETLEEMTDRLREARDRLLPKLMNGTISV